MGQMVIFLMDFGWILGEKVGEMPKKVIFGWILDGFGCANYFFLGLKVILRLRLFQNLNGSCL